MQIPVYALKNNSGQVMTKAELLLGPARQTFLNLSYQLGDSIWDFNHRVFEKALTHFMQVLSLKVLPNLIRHPKNSTSKLPEVGSLVFCPTLVAQLADASHPKRRGCFGFAQV